MFITCCNYFPEFLLRFEQVISGIFSHFQLLHILIPDGQLVINDLFELSILAIDFIYDSRQDSVFFFWSHPVN